MIEQCCFIDITVQPYSLRKMSQLSTP